MPNLFLHRSKWHEITGFAIAAMIARFASLNLTRFAQAGTFSLPSPVSSGLSDSLGSIRGETGRFHFVGMNVEETVTDPILIAVGQGDPPGPVDLSFTGLDIAWIGAGMDHAAPVVVNVPMSGGGGRSDSP